MATVNKIIRVSHKIGGSPTDYASLVFRDPTAAYGLRLTATAAIVIEAGVALGHDGTGLYSYTVSGLTPGAAYDYWIERVYAGSTQRQQYNFVAPAADDGLPRYLDLASAQTMAASLVGIAAWNAATGDQQNAALAAATFDIDNAQRYQGRKYDLGQVLEFPRMAYESGRGPGLGYGWPAGAGTSGSDCGLLGAAVWDWDVVNNVAIVPQRIKVACLYQANSRLDGKRASALDKLFRGLKGEATGSLSESFDLATVLAATGGAIDLCRDAVAMLRPYILRQGRIL